MHGTYYNATIAAYVTLYLRLGKDEVGSSNLPSSSKNHQKLRFLMVFCCKKAKNGAIQNVGQMLTHTVTHTTKCAERAKEHRRGSNASSPVFFVIFLLT